MENRRCVGILWPVDAVVHPLAFPARTDNSCVSQIREVPGDLRLPLLQNLDEIADTDLLAIHEIKQPETGWVGQGGEERRKVWLRS